MSIEEPTISTIEDTEKSNEGIRGMKIIKKQPMAIEEDSKKAEEIYIRLTAPYLQNQNGAII